MKTKSRYLVCVCNDGYEASLERRKIYVAITDSEAEARDFVRVIDESGEDYLYPAASFLPISVTPTIKRALAAA
jgi:hypothetical protein